MFGDRLIKEDSNYFIEVYNKVEHETIKSKLEEINSYFKKFGFKTSLDIKLNENKRDEIQKEIELIKTIIDTREKLKRDNKNFEYAQGDLVDYYTYQIKANQAKLDYLIKLAKTNGIQVDMVNDKKFTFLESEEAG